MITCRNCGNEITYRRNINGFRHVEGFEPPMTPSMEICEMPEFEPEMTPALVSVLVERIRQDDKWGEQNLNPYIYLAVLLEEVGEFAQAVLQTQYGGDKGGWSNVRKEAIHTAAVALALLECLDRQG